MYAYLLGEMDKRYDVDGSTLLDNSVTYLSGECGDADIHSHASMPVILGGRGGRAPSGAWSVNAGRHVRYPRWFGSEFHWAVKPTYPGRNPGERSVKDLLWAMMRLAGVPASASPSFGDATAPLDLA
jgi:hypothetical protein